MASILDKIKNMINPEDEYEEDFDDEEDDDETDAYAKQIKKQQQAAAMNYRQKPNRLVKVGAKSQMQVVVYKPESFGQDTTEMANAFIAKNALVINLEGKPKEDSRRILDFLSGVAFAQDGKINRIATDTYMITPNNMDLIGDEDYKGFAAENAYY